VVHRDVSPQNILISYEGAVKVVDFGVALVRSTLSPDQDVMVVGKFSYMSPEQLRARPVDRRADIFSLGIILYEMTSDHRLFKGNSREEIVKKVLAEPIAPPSRWDSRYPRELEEVVMRALKRAPEERFQTVREMEQALERFIVGTGDPVTPSDVGELMGHLFTDRISYKDRLQRECEAENVDGVPEVDLASSSSESVHRRGAKDRRGLGLVAVALVAVVAVGALIYWFGLRSSTAPMASTGADQGTTRIAPDLAAGPPRRTGKISISISATPESATIEFGGRKVANPYETELLAGQGEVEVVVSAPEHIPRTFKVSLAKGGLWDVTLKREPPPPTKRVRSKRRIRRVSEKKRDPTKKKQQLDDDDVAISPYSQQKGD
jgi:serine/threonine-protein kinase